MNSELRVTYQDDEPFRMTFLKTVGLVTFMYLTMVLFMNIAAPAGHASSFPGGEADPDIVAMISAASIALFLAVVYVPYYQFNPSPPTKERRMYLIGTCFMIFFVGMLPAYFAIRVELYAGAYRDFSEKVNPTDGEQFEFEGGAGKMIWGANERFGGSDTTLTPVVFFGGNGGDIYSNPRDCKSFLDPVMEEPGNTQRFDCYTLSYRGFQPNRGFPVESNMIADATALFELVRVKYPDVKRIPLLSHSLGAAVAAGFAANTDNELACVAMAMGFSNARNVELEISYYFAWIYTWLSDEWNTITRMGKFGVDVPLLILSAGEDWLIPPHHQTRVFEAASHVVNKTLIYDSKAGHGDLFQVLTSDREKYVGWWDSCLERMEM
jgi:pimeloyl-ACP methyl ester carboxylesterase